MKHLYFWLIAAACLVICFNESCKKNKTVPDFDITYTGYPIVGYSVSFTSNLSQVAGLTYLWTFGDGSTSTKGTAGVKYDASKTYTVTLTINNDTLRRKSKTIFIGPNYSFITKGVSIPGEMLSFMFNYSPGPGCTYLWDFGDGTTSADSMPGHVYGVTGTYKVTILVNGDIAHRYFRYLTILKDPVYTHMVAGLRNWRGNLVKTFAGTTLYDSTVNTSFLINYVDAVSISVGGDTLVFDPAKSIGNTLYYKGKPPYTGNVFDMNVSFNYIKDSIGYFSASKEYPPYSGTGHHPGYTYEYKLHSP